jgi:hypothetical protein
MPRLLSLISTIAPCDAKQPRVQKKNPLSEHRMPQLVVSQACGFKAYGCADAGI